MESAGGGSAFFVIAGIPAFVETDADSFGMDVSERLSFAKMVLSGALSTDTVGFGLGLTASFFVEGPGFGAFFSGLGALMSGAVVDAVGDPTAEFLFSSWSSLLETAGFAGGDILSGLLVTGALDTPFPTSFLFTSRLTGPFLSNSLKGSIRLLCQRMPTARMAVATKSRNNLLLVPFLASFFSDPTPSFLSVASCCASLLCFSPFLLRNAQPFLRSRRLLSLPSSPYE